MNLDVLEVSPPSPAVSIYSEPIGDDSRCFTQMVVRRIGAAGVKLPVEIVVANLVFKEKYVISSEFGYRRRVILRVPLPV